MTLSLRFFIFIWLLGRASVSIALEADEEANILALCAKHLAAGSLITGRSGTAYACYHEILGENPKHPKALAGIKKIEQIYADWSWQALQRKHKINSHKFISRLSLVNRNSKHLADLRQAYQKTFPNQPLPTGKLPKPPLYDQIHGDVGDLKIQLNTLKQQFLDIEQALDKKLITDIQASELTEVKQRFERLQQEFYAIKDPSQIFYAVIITLWQQLKHTEEKLIEAQAQVDEHNTIYAALSERDEQLDSQYKTQVDELSQLRSEAETLRSNNQRLTHEQQQNRQRISQLSTDKQQLTQSSEQYRNQYYDSQQAYHAERRQAEKLVLQIDRLQNTIQGIKDKIAKTCSKERLHVCRNQASCAGAGGVWELGECLKESQCHAGNPQGCRIPTLCEGIQAVWTEETGCDYALPCHADSLLECSNPISCVKAGGRWHHSCLPSELLH